MEGNRRDLERESDKQKRQTDQKKTVLDRNHLRHEDLDVDEVRGAGCAVDHRDAIKEERR